MEQKEKSYNYIWYFTFGVGVIVFIITICALKQIEKEIDSIITYGGVTYAIVFATIFALHTTAKDLRDNATNLFKEKLSKNDKNNIKKLLKTVNISLSSLIALTIIITAISLIIIAYSNLNDCFIIIYESLLFSLFTSSLVLFFFVFIKSWKLHLKLVDVLSEKKHFSKRQQWR
ncbi:hypothetical protein [Macrococcus armenti]|uniref:hypothetical protein n=1 Tax=Macrococcus armenti TaxID=2875764 RepID=UPI001CCAE64B|nr:hypothetical protein [Macrococcus armenti]UBH09212.1 hypothetical protein LAU41_03320 [Macrococcus armenti]UBH11508.1 hypothetical protein LAU38_03315 [Macrococcus armenti]